MSKTFQRLRRALALVPWLALVLPAVPARGAEKVVLLEESPGELRRFKVAPDGSRLYFAARDFLEYDAQGRRLRRIPIEQRLLPRDLVPLPDGRFLGCASGLGGKLLRLRPDASYDRALVVKGDPPEKLRMDMTGWTAPYGMAVDAKNHLVFVLDTSIAPAGKPDPDWSRVAVYDLEGKFVRELRRYDGKAPGADDALRTWYEDLAVDPARQRLYLLARRTRELIALSYEGRELGRVPAPEGEGLATFPDGRVAVDGAGLKVRILSPDLAPIGEVDAARAVDRGNIGDLETDAAGRLYATVRHPSTSFVRWSADLRSVEAFGPKHIRYEAGLPGGPWRAGSQVEIRVGVAGRPEPNGVGAPRLRIRPADGSDLGWAEVPSTLRGEMLRATLPADLRGLYEVAVHFGPGPIDRAARPDDPTLQTTIAIAPARARASVTILADRGRRAFARGESIELHLVRAGGPEAPAPVRIQLRRGDESLASTAAKVGRSLAAEVPAETTRGLSPGRYRLVPACEGHEAYPLDFEIAMEGPDSPLQRILYHEFAQGATARKSDLPSMAERLAFVDEHARAVNGLGFTRETDRMLGHLDLRRGPAAWPRDQTVAPAEAPGLPPIPALGVPRPEVDWQGERYLDRMSRYGLRYDTQLLEHCSNAPLTDTDRRPFVAMLQRAGQWLSRYPAFYGFNYHDELFFPAAGPGAAYLKQLQGDRFAGKPPAAAKIFALGEVYDRFNAAVRRAAPGARVTVTPLWQHTAASGCYPPAIYASLDETYSHYLSEGFHLPWYPAHSSAMVRRPGKPLMAVIDAAQNDDQGLCYWKDAMQVAARGAQGVGVEHTRPFELPRSADALRLANALLRDFGPVFAEAPPADEAAVLFSYTQDVSERPRTIGSPHWQRVFALHGAGLMAGVPMTITFEEDVAAGGLLDGEGRPRVPMLFLAGQTAPLPGPVVEAISAFAAAGGKVFTDAAGAPFPAATRLEIDPGAVGPGISQGYAADSSSPLLWPVFETLAAALREAAGPHRRFPIDTDAAWVAKNGFDGGAVRYAMVVAEAGPHPWAPGEAWSMRIPLDKRFVPRTVAVSLPFSGGVIYDAFERTTVEPKVEGGRARLSADLTAFPARLYALAPEALGPPEIAAGVAGSTLHVRVAAVDASGKPIRGRVPIRLVLRSDREIVRESVRGTGPDGTLRDRLELPAIGREWILEATELLGGRGASVSVAQAARLGRLLAARPDGEVVGEDQVRDLLREAGARLELVESGKATLSPVARRALATALKKRGIELVPDRLPTEARPGVYLAAGTMAALLDPKGQGDDLLRQARAHGQLPFATSAQVPGPGRGFASAAFSPRAEGEHAICLVGGDEAGLGRSAEAFAEWVSKPGPKATTPTAPAKEPTLSIAGKAAEVPPPVRLRDRVGVKLSGVVAEAGGPHLLLGVDGFVDNLALVVDRGDRGEVVRTARVGQSPRLASLHLGAGGAWFGGSARTSARHGQEFRRVDAANGDEQVFASFGDFPREWYRFAANDRGDAVIAPGPYGLACWRRGPAGWAIAWTRDDWKEFPRLDWPVSDLDERSGTDHAVIPAGADFALILHGEKANNGWISNDKKASGWLAAVRLSDGGELWKRALRDDGELIFPRIVASPSGRRVVVPVQVGSFGKETHRFDVVDSGRLLGSWTSTAEPLAVEVSDPAGRVAIAYRGRHLEVREPDGTPAVSRTWPDQPHALAFLPGGRDLVVADDGGWLSRVDTAGEATWSVRVRDVAALAVRGDRIYAACRDGRLHAFGIDGRALWTLDANPALHDPDPMSVAARAAEVPDSALHRAIFASTATAEVPNGPNLLRDGRAKLKVGGVAGWMSEGKVEVTPAELTDGSAEGKGAGRPWLNLDEYFWDLVGGRPVWAEIELPEPTRVRALTVREDPRHPDSWPAEGFVQNWDPATKRWTTAAFGLFLDGPVQTYRLDLEGVTKLRYVRRLVDRRNPHTTEIEVR